MIEESPVVGSRCWTRWRAAARTSWTRRACSTRCFPSVATPGFDRRRRWWLFAVRANASAQADDEKAWPELARAIVEADFAAADALTDERQHSRRLAGDAAVLRHLVETDGEADLAHAIVQAAAVWFDVDARIFQRDLAGDFVLHTALPGARVEDAARRLSAHWFAESADTVRLGRYRNGAPWRGSPRSCWSRCRSAGRRSGCWLSSAQFPADAEPLFAVLGRVVGVQLDTIRARRRDRTREHFEALVEQGGPASELLAVRLVSELADMAGAAYASLVLNRRGHERRLVCIGTSG